MIRQDNPRHRHVRRTLALDSSPPAYAEYAYYALLVNASMAAAWDVSVPLLGAVVMALLAACCLKRLNGPFHPNYKSLRLPVACAIFSVAILVLVHDQPLVAPES